MSQLPAITGDSHGGWTCFHCGDHFTDHAAARLHFGPDESATPACKIKGAEGGLLKALRDAERQADEHLHMMHDESTEAGKAYHALRCRSEQSIRAAEELGYERGLADGRAQEWMPLNTAPYSTPVRIKAGNMTFIAELLPSASMNEDGECDQWQAVHEGEHPPCWSGGACWASNENEDPSLQPVGWMPLPPAPAQEGA